MNKREAILNSIIKEYLKHNSPIGSSELGLKLKFNISPSTIRVYFKQLSLDGALEQLHVSSGRVPTSFALKEYWLELFSNLETIKISSLDNLKELSNIYGIYCMVDLSEENTLCEILNVSKRYLILVFDKNEIVLTYNEKVEKFLQNMLGYSIGELKNILSQIGLYELHKKLDVYMKNDNFIREGKMLIYEMAKDSESEEVVDILTDADIMRKIKEGVYFDGLIPEGYMAVKQKAVIGNEDADMLCVGHLKNDFESFVNKLSA